MNRQIKRAHVNGCFHLQINYLWVEPIIILQHFVFNASFRQKYFCGPNECLFQQGKVESCCSLHSPSISPCACAWPRAQTKLSNLNTSWGTKQEDKTILINISLWLPGQSVAKARRKKSMQVKKWKPSIVGTGYILCIATQVFHF